MTRSFMVGGRDGRESWPDRRAGVCTLENSSAVEKEREEIRSELPLSTVTKLKCRNGDGLTMELCDHD